MLHRNLPLKAAALALAVFLWFWVLLTQQTVITVKPLTLTLPVVLRSHGAPPAGYRISARLDPPLATVTGPADRVAVLKGIETEDLAVEALRGRSTHRLGLAAPPGVTVLSRQVVTVSVEVKAEAATSRSSGK